MIPDSQFWFIPDSQFWWHMFVTLALEVAGVVLVGWVVTRFVRSATACRFVWRTVLVCLLLVCVSDFSGVGLMVADGLSRQSEETPKQKFFLERQTDGTRDNSKPVRFVPFIAPTPDAMPIVWWPGLIWAIGCTVVLARLVTAHGLLMVLRRKGRLLTDEVVVEEARAMAKRFGVRRRVVLIEGRRVVSPFAFGIFRAAIALPAGFRERFRRQEREAILAHEMAHVAAGDPIWQLVANVVSALFWWHPAVWLARRWLYDAAEMAADEAVSMLENGPQTLAECLVAMARNVGRPLWWGGVGMNGTERRSILRRRVERLLNLPKGVGFVANARQRAARLMGAALFVFAAFLVSGFVQEKSGPYESTEVWRKSPLAVICSQIKARASQGPLSVAVMLIEAKELYEAGKLPQALAKLQVVLTLEPGNKAALYYRGLVREALRRNGAGHEYLDWNQPLLYPTYPPKLAQLSTSAPFITFADPASGTVTNLYQFQIDANGITEPFYQPEQEYLNWNQPFLFPTYPPKLAQLTAFAPMIGTLAPTAAGVPSDDRTAVKSWQFHVDTKALRDALKNAGKDVSKAKMNVSLREWLQDKGVDWSDSRKAVFFVEPKGLLVRGTMSDIKRVEKAVELMGTVQPSQLTLESEVAEISGDAGEVLKGLGVDLNASQIFDAQRWRELMDALRKKTGAEVVRMPKVTTLTERTALVSMADELADGRKSGLWLTLLPKISADTFSIELSVMFARGTTKDKDENTPQPTGSAHVIVSDHGTLVFVCDVPGTPGKKDVVLVTATVIDPVGNQTHTDEQVKAQGWR